MLTYYTIFYIWCLYSLFFIYLELKVFLTPRLGLNTSLKSVVGSSFYGVWPRKLCIHDKLTSRRPWNQQKSHKSARISTIFFNWWHYNIYYSFDFILKEKNRTKMHSELVKTYKITAVVFFCRTCHRDKVTSRLAG